MIESLHAQNQRFLTNDRDYIKCYHVYLEYFSLDRYRNYRKIPKVMTLENSEP